MNIGDIIIILILLCIIAGIFYYLYRAKKRGQKCIGCPYGKGCGNNCTCSDKIND